MFLGVKTSIRVLFGVDIARYQQIEAYFIESYYAREHMLKVNLLVVDLLTYAKAKTVRRGFRTVRSDSTLRYDARARCAPYSLRRHNSV